MGPFVDYHWTLAAVALTGIMMLVQALVADVAGMKAGHRAGHPVAPNRDDFHFRATRALANTNETVAVFLSLALAGVLLGADSGILNAGAVLYLVGRLAHMAMYYANLAPARSIAFGISLAGAAVMGYAVVPAML